MIMRRKDDENTLRRILIPYIVHNLLDLFPSQVHDACRRTSIATVRTRVSTSRVLEEPHEADGVEIIYNQSPANCYPCTSVRWRREASRHLCVKYEISAHLSMYASVTAETHAPWFCFQLNGRDLPRLHAL